MGIWSIRVHGRPWQEPALPADRAGSPPRVASALPGVFAWTHDKLENKDGLYSNQVAYG